MALTKDRTIDRSANPGRQRVGKVAASTVIYKGAALCKNSAGYLVTGANTAGLKFVGWADQHIDNSSGANGAKEVLYSTGISESMKNATGAAAVAQANMPGPVWLHDDETVRGTPGNGVFVGFAEHFEGTRIRVFGAPECEGIVPALAPVAYDHVAVTADTTVKLFTVPAGKRFRLLRAEYINPTGLAQDATNYFTVKVLAGATVMASWSTLTGAQGTIAADTFVDLVNSATDSELIAAAAAVIALFLDETGTASLPAGRIVLHGYYLPL